MASRGTSSAPRSDSPPASAPRSSSRRTASLVRHTDDDPIGVTAGVFDASGLTEVVSVQSGADRISLLEGTPDGGLADPSLATSYSTGIDPTQVVAAPPDQGRIDRPRRPQPGEP